MKKWRTDVCRCMASPDPRIKVHQIWGRMSIGALTIAEDKMKWKQAKPDLAWTTTIKTQLGIGNNDFVAIQQEVSNISTIKNLWFPKKWAKIHQNCLRPDTPYNCHHAKFHRDRWTTLEKSYKNFFTPFNILAPQRNLLGQRSPVWVVVYLPPLATCKISSRSDDPSPRYLLPNFGDFDAGVTHKITESIQ